MAVAVSMICGKDLLVFDEPTSGLDFDSMTQVAGLIRRLSDMGKVIFIVTHDFEFVSRTCSRILHFDEGEMPDDVPVTMDTLPTFRKQAGTDRTQAKPILFCRLLTIEKAAWWNVPHAASWVLLLKSPGEVFLQYLGILLSQNGGILAVNIAFPDCKGSRRIVL